MVETTKERLARLPFKWPWPEQVEHFRRDVLPQEDYDPATLFVFSQMAMQALLALIKNVEKKYGEDGQRLCFETIKGVGYAVASQCFEGVERPEGMSDAELASLLMTLVNVILYASPEEAGVDEDGQGYWFDVLWCPVGETFNRFDCRLHRYFADGIFRAAIAKYGMGKFAAAFESTIPAGADRCRCVCRVRKPGETNVWAEHSRKLAQKALLRAGWEATGDKGPVSPQR